MAAGKFDITVEHDGPCARLRLAGELDLARAEQLHDAVRDARAQSDIIELDLRGLHFIDSSGLRALMAIHNATTDGGFTYHLISGPPEVHRTFVLTGLDTVFHFAEAPAST